MSWTTGNWNAYMAANPGATIPGAATPTPAPTPTPPPNTPAPAPQQPVTQTSAYGQLMAMMQGWGLDAGTAATLANDIQSWLTQSYSEDAISYMLTQTPEYKARFSGNDARIANGLAPLTPAQYLAAEAGYKQVFSAYGVPGDFYSSHQELGDLIGRDVSVSELTDRVSHAMDLVNQTDPSARQALQSYYGVDSGHLVAYFLDPKVAQPILDKRAAAAQIGGAALQQGLHMTDQARAEHFADLGIDSQQALKDYGQVAYALPTESQIGSRFGTKIDQGTLEDATLGGLASAQRAIDQANLKEQALFAGAAGQAASAQSRAAGLGRTQAKGSY